MEIQAGMTCKVETVVDNTNVASVVGSGLLDVFATPMMIAQMELAASTCLEEALEEGQTTVGIHIDVEHVAATPVGMKVTTIAKVMAVEGRKIEFEVLAEDEAGAIGKGKHTRVIINAARFMEKASARGK